MVRFLILANARTGSTYLLTLFRRHYAIDCAGELLNEESRGASFSMKTLDEINSTLNDMTTSKSPIVGFKVFPEQLIQCNLRLDDLVRYLNIKHIFIIWRESTLDTLVSFQIAFTTGIWWTSEPATAVNSCNLSEQEIDQYVTNSESEWRLMGDQWPLEIQPAFVKYEDILINRDAEMNRLFYMLGLEEDKIDFDVKSQRQNPFPLKDKIVNWNDLTPEFRTVTVHVPKILTAGIQKHMLLPKEKLHLVPDYEPLRPPGGWRYRVAEPFVNQAMRSNVMDALESKAVSSAGLWPKCMSGMLKNIFNAPTAHPTCNGFASLVLALQAAKVGPGDHVILPAFTMIAVANAVSFMKATPVFVDNAPNQYNPGYNEIARAATNNLNLKAVIVTHTYGVPTNDMDAIVRFCKERRCVLIEDISECMGVSVNSESSVKLLGTYGDFTCASMYANKMLHAADGGFVLAKDPKLQITLESLANHGFTSGFHFVHFQRTINAKINGLGAAAACASLASMNDVISHRNELATMYRQSLATCPVICMPECGHNDTPWVFGICCQSKAQRNALRAHLARYGIETRDYFFPLHLQPAYYQSSEEMLELPVAEELASKGLYLPTHFNLNTEDIQYICACIQLYFYPNKDHGQQPQAPKQSLVSSVRIRPGQMQVEVRTFDQNGECINSSTLGHPLIQAVRLGLDVIKNLLTERWDTRKEVIHNLELCIKDCTEQQIQDTQTCFQPYLDYFKSQINFEPQQTRPWLKENIEEISPSAQCVPTTTDLETQQLLAWLCCTHASTVVVEIGCWLGHTTMLLADVVQSIAATRCKNADIMSPRIYALDQFIWQAWMNRFVEARPCAVDASFLPAFIANTESYGEVIKPVEWCPETSHVQHLHTELSSQRIDLVYVDFSRDADELESAWQLLKAYLVPDHSIIVINGVIDGTLNFIVRHQNELQPIAKPHTLAKAFKYCMKDDQQSLNHSTSQPLLQRYVSFQAPPDWNHHHNNAFCVAIEKLKEEFHNVDAPVKFIVAVENYLCDDTETLAETPWIGVVHSAPHYPELFYTPDLHRLCSEDKYRASMSTCKGLFTLTKEQAKYLSKHLPEKSLPICPVLYPFRQDMSQCKQSILIQTWNKKGFVKCVLVGSYARNIDLFFSANLPANVRKVLLVGDELMQSWAERAPKDIAIYQRLNEEEYEAMLQDSIIFLPLKHNGAANTITMECIARNVPIVVPKFGSCIEYLGIKYPLYYDSTADLPSFDFITKENVQSAIEYLKNLDKQRFSIDNFCESVKSSAVLLALPPFRSENTYNLQPSLTADIERRFDVTVCICSYRRTHHLPLLLERLWNNQTFKGRMQIIIWNNNEARCREVTEICDNYQQQSCRQKSLELINSTQNYFCAVRWAVIPLMRSEELLICDDDIVPEATFIDFFLAARRRLPRAVLCTRGHKFLSHTLDLNNPTNVWLEYEALRFVNDDQPEQQIHFAHADACLISRAALRECVSTPLPDPLFVLVDDYWMSFVLNHKFNRPLTKLCTFGASKPFQRTDDSDQVGLALHTNPDVKDARIRLYIHHMLNNWPVWNASTLQLEPINTKCPNLKEAKLRLWEDNQVFVGFNIPSQLTECDYDDLSRMGVRCVRIGAVGVGRKNNFEFSGLLEQPDATCDRICNILQHFQALDIGVVITLDRRLACPEVWETVAARCGHYPNLVGYDIMNEPFAPQDLESHWTRIHEDKGHDIDNVVNDFRRMINAIRSVDSVTPVIIEPTLWAHHHALELMSKYAKGFLKSLHSDNVMVSVHFYQPQVLTMRQKNRYRFSFPGEIPIFEGNKHSETVLWNADKIQQEVCHMSRWSKETGLKIFIGEFGMARDLQGASGYLKAVADACFKFKLNCFVYSFRDRDWDAMNYELGTATLKGFEQQPVSLEQNPLMQVLYSAIQRSNDCSANYDGS